MVLPPDRKYSKMTEFTVELSSIELEGAILDKTFVSPENDLVFAVEHNNNHIYHELILKSCKDTKYFLKIDVLMFLYERKTSSEPFDEPNNSKTILPSDLQKLPLFVMNFGSGKKRLTFKIHYKIESTCSNFFHINDMVEDYAALMKDQESSDVTLIVEGEKLHAHKLILSTRSSVFSAMFKCDMLEKEKGQVEIKEIQASTFKHLLEYIYTNRILHVHNAAINWLELMLAADMYAVNGLKSICSKKLSEDLVPENAIDVFILSDRLKDDELKKSSASNIILNKSKVFNSEKYKEFLKSNLDLALELLNDLMSSKYFVKEE